ncbi:hypothetical protein Peur_055871 [Populus x canadensis]
MFKNTVSDRNCEKIHNMAPDFYCCGAGTAADTEAVTGFQPGMGSLFKYHGHVQAALVQTSLDHIYTWGTETLPFSTMASGSLAAMAIFESVMKDWL